MDWNKDLTFANFLTILRIVLVPLFIYYILQDGTTDKIIAFVMFAVASLTDLVDGYIARKFKQETELGKFLDPLADKMLVIATLIVFILLEAQIQIWMVLVIIGRDMLVTTMRYLAIREGWSLRTSRFGKAKTAFQMIAMVIILLIFAVRSPEVHTNVNQYYNSLEQQSHIVIAAERFSWAQSQPVRDLWSAIEAYSYSVPYFLMLFTTIITALSGLRYLYTNYQLFLPPFDKTETKTKD